MNKLNFGTITNPQTGKSKDIVLPWLSKRGLVDVLIGGGITVARMAYTVITAFRNGAISYDEKETEVLESLDLIRCSEELK